MARDKKVIFGAINITIHPHTPKLYIDLFNDTRRFLSKSEPPGVNLSADRYALIRFFYPRVKGQSDDKPYEGEIIKYTHIDKNTKWYSLSKNEEAQDEDRDQINIPDDLKPLLKKFAFVFIPNVHLLVYESHIDNTNLSPKEIVKFLKQAFSAPEIIKKYGIVNVIPITEPSNIKEMLSQKNIQTIEMTTIRPNPDNLMTAESKMKERFKKLGIREETKTLKSDREGNITPDDELETDAIIASRNGNVSIKIKNEFGHTVTLSSEDKPLLRTFAYNPNSSSPIELLTQEAYAIKEEFNKLLGKNGKE